MCVSQYFVQGGTRSNEIGYLAKISKKKKQKQKQRLMEQLGSSRLLTVKNKKRKMKGKQKF